MRRKLTLGVGVALGVAVAAGLASGATGRRAPDPAPTANVRAFGPAIEQRSRLDLASLDARIEQVAAKRDVVGLAVGIVENGRIAFVKGYGMTAANGGAPVGIHTVFRWASLSKGVAATMVGELAYEGRLSLSAPVGRYAPSLRLPGGAEQYATIDQLLSHRLGLPRNSFDNKLEGGADPRVLRGQLASVKPQCAPGLCHAYQNVAYDAASEIVQSVTGRSYQQAVMSRLFAPLGMTDASLTRAGLISARSWARPHVGRATVEVNDNYYRVPAAGGVNSSVLDLARWMQAQMGMFPDVIAPSVLANIHNPRIGTDRHLGIFNHAMGPSRYSLGWRDYTYLGHHLVGHQGAVRGYRATILFDPQLRAGIVMLWNAQTARPVGIQLEFLDRLYNLPRRDWLGLDGGAGAGEQPVD